MEEIEKLNDESKNENRIFLIGIFSFITIIVGFIGLFYSACNSSSFGNFVTSFDTYSDIKRGTTWTNGNTRVVVVRVYENKVVYTRYSYSGRVMETCTLSKRVFKDRYTRVVGEGEI